MYRQIMVLLDNSDYSLWGLDRAIEIAGQFNSVLVGAHVYAAKLHEDRFVQMEPGLPARYQFPEELKKQRRIHGELIEKGLDTISNSYLDVFQERCGEASVSFQRKSMEGKNYSAIVKDVEEHAYGLVAMGVRGLGEVSVSHIGSVCERVTRRIKSDTLVAKNGQSLAGGHVAVGIDGSQESYAAMDTAVKLAKKFDCRITALAVFDPNFHYKVFHSIAEVLSEEAGQTFRFKEQEKLHEEIINSGLEKIYRDNLDAAAAMAEKDGFTAGNGLRKEVLAGKPYEAIGGWLARNEVSLLALGKVGVHCDDGLDIGSNAEFLLRYAPCNVLFTSRRMKPQALPGEGDVEWTTEAREMLERIPGFVRNMVRGHMEANARKKGLRIVTMEMMLEAKRKAGM